MEITHNSYKIFRIKNQESRIKTLLSWFLVLLSYSLFSQDSIVPQSDISEKTNLKFQEYFFKAITEKAIGNNERAIESLEECNQLIPNNKSVLFEMSKNLLQLNRIRDAVDFANQALKIDPDNIWILEHLVKTHKRYYEIDKAIEVQKRIVALQPQKKQQLVYLYLQNRDKTTAKKTLNELAEAKMLNSRLRRIKASLENTNKPKLLVTSNISTNLSLKATFEKKKTFVSLQKLLTDLDTKNDRDLLKYSEEGMTLFPAQPLVYLMNGKALNKQKKYKEAIDSLQNGIDFVIDNIQLEANFYTQLVKAYEALGDTKNARKYRKKLKL